MLALLIRSFLFLFVMFWYSLGIWTVVDNYFKDQFRTYLEKQFESNKYMKPENIPDISDICSVKTKNCKKMAISKYGYLDNDGKNYRENLITPEGIPKDKFCNKCNIMEYLFYINNETE